VRICDFYRCHPFGKLRAGSEPFAALEDKLREGAPAKKRKPRFFTSLRSVQNDKNGVSTAVTQKLLEHSSPDLTNKVYTNVVPVLRHAVDQIPVGDWL